MNVTLKYRLNEEGRKAALLAGRPASELVTETVEVADLAPFADVLHVTEAGEAFIDVSSAKNYSSARVEVHGEYVSRINVFGLALPAPPADAAALAAIARKTTADARAFADLEKAAVAEAAAKTRAFEEQEAAKRQAVYDEFMGNPRARALFYGGNDRYFRIDYIDSQYQKDIPEAVRSEAIGRRDADAVAKAEAEAAKEAADREWVAAFIADHGDAAQQGRLAESLLPEDELLDLVRDVTFAALEAFEVYQKMDKSDVPCACEYETCKIVFASQDAEDATPEEWERLTAIRAACAATGRLQDATCTLRRHTATREDCEETATRAGVMVIATAGPFSVRREFAA